MTAPWPQIAALGFPTSGYFDFPSLDLSAYKVVMLVGAGIRVTTDGSYIGLRASVSGSYLTAAGSYDYLQIGYGQTNTDDEDRVEGDTVFPLTLFDANLVGNAAAEHGGFVAWISSPTVLTTYKNVISESQWLDASGQAWRASGAGRIKTLSAIDGLRVIGSSNLIAGRVTLHGLRTS